MQLPLKDASGAEKAKEKLDERVRAGRRLRRGIPEPRPHDERADGVELEPLPSQGARRS